MFELKIETGNDVFTDDPGAEVARILRHVADMADQGYTSGPLYDYNGNAVGSWSL